MKKVYCSCDSNFSHYYSTQSGRGFTDIIVYRGSPYQRGYGFGSLFKRFGIPILKFIGKHALKAGVNIGQDILNEKKVKEAIISRGKESLGELTNPSLEKLNSIIDQKGRGIKRDLYKKSTRKIKKKKDIF